VGYRDVTKAEIEAEELQRDQEIDYSFASVLQRSKNKEWTFLPHGCVSSHEMWRINTLELTTTRRSECTLWYPTEEALLDDLWVMLVETPLDPCIVSIEVTGNWQHQPQRFVFRSEKGRQLLELVPQLKTFVDFGGGLSEAENLLVLPKFELGCSSLQMSEAFEERLLQYHGSMVLGWETLSP